MLVPLVLLTSCLVGADGPMAVGSEPLRAAAPSAIGGETRDVILLLDSGPLHLRFHISLGGRPLPDHRQQYVDRLIRSLDANGDGKLTRDETDRSPLLRKKLRAAAKEFLQSLGQRQLVSRRDIAQTVERVGGETVVYRQDNSSSDNDGELFKFLDSDSSGMLDRKEIAAATLRLLEKDGDRDECVSFQEILPQPEPDLQPDLLVLQPQLPERPTATISTIMRDTKESLLPRRMIRLYDRDRDRKLSRSEMGWTEKQFNFLDTDGDLKLDAKELTFIDQTPLDVELIIDLEPADQETPAVRVLSLSGVRIDVTKRPDFVKIQFAGAVVSFARRYIDPLAAAMDNAMLQFNNMDVDGNGYLEKNETTQRIRFARGLFEAIDFDGDGKIFGEEMEEYIRVRSEPSATSCRINIFDTGHGFFMALDSNGDGRIGVRERRQAAHSLQAMDRDGRNGLMATEPDRHFHVEFVRGSYQMFGAMDPTIAQTSDFQQRAIVGPIWFQGWDRNGDGDLTWSEFQGYRADFHRIDKDHDGLIDPTEAALVEQ